MIDEDKLFPLQALTAHKGYHNYWEGTLTLQTHQGRCTLLAVDDESGSHIIQARHRRNR